MEYCSLFLNLDNSTIISGSKFTVCVSLWKIKKLKNSFFFLLDEYTTFLWLCRGGYVMISVVEDTPHIVDMRREKKKRRVYANGPIKLLHRDNIEKKKRVKSTRIPRDFFFFSLSLFHNFSLIIFFNINWSINIGIDTVL